MPLLDADTLEPIGMAPQFQSAAPRPPTTYSWSEIGDAAARDNSLISLFIDANDRSNMLALEAQPGYAPSDDDFVGYEDYADEVVWARSPADLQRIKQRIDDERHAHEVLGNSGWSGMAAGLVSGVLDPVNLIPVGGSLAKSANLGRRIWESTKYATRAGFLSSTASEAILQNTQMTRDIDDALVSISAGTFLSAALGGAVGLVAGVDRKALAEGLKAATLDARRAWAGAEGGGGSAGAAAVRTETLSDVTLQRALGTEKLGDHGVIVGTPFSRLASSDSLVARQVARDLTETSMHFEGEARGITAPQAVETKIAGWRGNLYAGIKALDQAFAQHRFGKSVWFGPLRATAQDWTGQRSPQKLAFDQFKTRVAMAMRRDDKDPMFPEVEFAARELRREVFDPLKEEAIKLELLDPDVTTETAWSYLTRVFDHERIRGDRTNWEGKVLEWFQGQREEARSRGDTIENWTKLANRAKQNMDRLDVELKRQEDLDITGMRAKAQAERRLVSEMRREHKVRGQRVAILKRRLAAAQSRIFKPTDRLPADDELVRLLQDARGLKEPERLVERVRKLGGLKDSDGLLKARGFKPIRKRNGKPIKTKDWHLEIIDPEARAIDARSLDQVSREVGAEEGFLERRVGQDGHIDDPSADDLIDALETDAFAKPVYADFGADGDGIARWREAQAFKTEMERQGIDIEWAPEKVAQALGLIDEYIPDTPAARERVRQASLYERFVERDLANEQGAQDQLFARMLTAEMKAKEALDRATRMRGRADMMVKERNASKRQFERFTAKVDEAYDLVNMDDADLRDVVRQVTDGILHGDGTASRALTVNIRGALKERTFRIPDVMVEQWLENDVERVARIYSRQMSADVELSRAFGSPDMKEQIEEVQRSYAKLRTDRMDPKTREMVPLTAKELKRIDRQQKDDLADLKHIRDVLRGIAGRPSDPDSIVVRSSRIIRALNYVRLLGGAQVTNLVDAFKVVAQHGVGRITRSAIVPFITNMKAVRLAAAENRRLGIALDIVLDTRAMNIADLGEEFGKGNVVERGAQWASDKFGLVNLLSAQTALFEHISGIVSQTRILEEVENLVKGTATAAEREHLAWLGVSYDSATRLHQMALKHAQAEPGLRIPNSVRWDDREAAEVLRAALIKETRTAVIQPLAGDRPRWMSTELGKVAGQFRSFTIAAMSKITAEGLQRRDWAVLQGLVGMIALGMLVYRLKTPAEDLSDDPAVWIREGIDRSGVTGWLFEAHNTIEKVSGGWGVNALIGDKPSGRFASRNISGALGGPTADLIDDVGTLVNRIGRGKWSQADTRRVRRALPLQNVWYLRSLFDSVEEDVNETFDIPERSERQPGTADY